MKATNGFIGRSNSSIATRSNTVNSRNLRKDWNQFWQALFMLLAGNSDPKIERISADSWRVYDPKSNQLLSFTSEQEVRVWLDQRYNF